LRESQLRPLLHCCGTVAARHNQGIYSDSALPTYAPPSRSYCGKIYTAGMQIGGTTRVNGISREMGEAAYPVDNMVNSRFAKDAVGGHVITFSGISARRKTVAGLGGTCR
jgi:hypothetical protein